MQRILPLFSALALSLLSACGVGGSAEEGNPYEGEVGTMTGFVRDGGETPVLFAEVSAFPVGTTVNAFMTPTSAAYSDPPIGLYALVLPAGDYDIYVRRLGVLERTFVDSVPISAGSTLALDLPIP